MTKLFFLRGSKEIKSIYLRIRNGEKIDCKVSTGIKVDESYWDKKRGWPKDHPNNYSYDVLVQDLNSILSSVRKFEIGPGKGRTIDRAWMEEAINYKRTNHQLDLVCEQLVIYKERLAKRTKNGRTGVAPGTLRNYNTTVGRLKKYEESIGHKLTLMDLNFRFHDEYLEFAQDSLELSINSIGRDIRNLKAMVSDAKDRGLAVNDSVFSRKFNAPTEKCEFVTLNPDELQILFDFEGPDFLENARSWLILGAWSGIRVNDLLNLDESNLLDDNGRRIIRYTQSKTGKVVRLAIHPHVEAIMVKNDWKFPRPISDVKFNEYIKELCRRAGFNQPVYGRAFDEEAKKRKKGVYPKWKVVSSHVMRRSFASNHFGRVPTSKIIAATGHSTEKQLLNYIGETLGDHVDDFLDLWSKNK